MKGSTAKKVSPPPQQDRSRDTYRAILAGAETLMAERSLDSIPVSEIAKASGVSVGNFYNRFADKAELLEAMHGEYEQERLAYLTDAFASDDWQDKDLRARCDGLVLLLTDFFLERTALIRSFVMFYRTNQAPPAIESGSRTLARLGAAVLVDAMPNDKDAAYRANLGLQTILALCREFILFEDEPAKRTLKLSRKKLIQHLQNVLYECVR